MKNSIIRSGKNKYMASVVIVGHVPKYMTYMNIYAQGALIGTFVGEELERIRVQLNKRLGPSTPSTPVTPTLPSTTIKSNEPCDYCVDRKKTNCRSQRTEYFPACFKGKKLRPI